jgi:hypothetical protein
MHFWMRFYFRTWLISMIFIFFGDTQVVLDILSLCVACQPSYFTRIIFPSPSFLFLLVGFDRRIM